MCISDFSLQILIPTGVWLDKHEKSIGFIVCFEKSIGNMCKSENVHRARPVTNPMLGLEETSRTPRQAVGGKAIENPLEFQASQSFFVAFSRHRVSYNIQHSTL